MENIDKLAQIELIKEYVRLGIYATLILMLIIGSLWLFIDNIIERRKKKNGKK